VSVNEVESVERPRHGWVYRRVVLPVLALLRMGASPRRLAWSIAIGIVVGINPLLGSTTLLCIGVAFVLRLNVPASQLANHAMYPLQLLLLLPFLHLGTRVFGTDPLPFTPKVLYADARSHPLELIRRLWMWEWHALVVWALIAVVAIPAIVLLLTPVLTRLMIRVKRHEYPWVG
jgi:uncharacterized protein (DUF2062 family)